MKLTIKDKNLYIEDEEILVSKNVNTYKLSVDYDKSYIGRQIYIFFRNKDIKKYELVGPDNIVTIPQEVLKETGTLFIGFFSPKIENDMLIDRYCSTFYSLTIISGAYDKDATPTEELTPTILEKYLQEMKDFYNESLKEYNSNADDRLKEYNNNAKIKTEEFNRDYELKKEEIDKVAEDVSQNKTDIEEIEKRVSASEQNAKTSETNAKSSEENAGEYLNEVKNISNAMTFANFEVDVETGELQINTPERFENAGFSVNENGDLEVEISG